MHRSCKHIETRTAVINSISISVSPNQCIARKLKLVTFEKRYGGPET